MSLLFVFISLFLPLRWYTWVFLVLFLLCVWFIRFVPYEVNEDDDYTSYENMAVFVISMYQYVTLAIIFSKGRPYRKTIFTNCESSTILKLISLHGICAEKENYLTKILVSLIGQRLNYMYITLHDIHVYTLPHAKL